MPTPVVATAGIWPSTAAAAFVRHQPHGTAVDVIAGALSRLLGPVTELLDVGAGPGTIGAKLVARGGHHHCIEPEPWLARRLLRTVPAHISRTVLATTWQMAFEDPALSAELVLCCNIPGLVDDAPSLWAACRPRARRALAWVVPAQSGPRSWCLSGFLPPDLHGEDTTPGIEHTLASLAGVAPPPVHQEVDWVWRQSFTSRRSAVAWCAARIPHGEDPMMRQRLASWCATHLTRAGRRWWATAPKRSALLVWT